MADDDPLAVERHYRVGGLLEAILAALRATGHDPDHLTVEDLAPVDAFHTRGREARWGCGSVGVVPGVNEGATRRAGTGSTPRAPPG